MFISFTKFFEANDNHRKPKKAPENTKMLKESGQKSNLHTIITTLLKKAHNRRYTHPEAKKGPATGRHLKEEAIGGGSHNF